MLYARPLSFILLLIVWPGDLCQWGSFTPSMIVYPRTQPAGSPRRCFLLVFTHIPSPLSYCHLPTRTDHGYGRALERATGFGSCLSKRKGTTVGLFAWHPHGWPHFAMWPPCELLFPRAVLFQTQPREARGMSAGSAQRQGGLRGSPPHNNSATHVTQCDVSIKLPAHHPF